VDQSECGGIVSKYEEKLEKLNDWLVCRNDGPE
jgi:hypothetical protein